MECLPEVIISSDCASENKNCSIYDLKSGNLLATFKEGNSAPRCLSLIGEDYLLSGFGNQLLKVWRISRRSGENSKIACPGNVTAIAVSNCGVYCVAGVEKSIYLWEVPTGELLAVISRHYQNISCLKFTSDGSYFISGGKDAVVMVWILPEVVSDRRTSQSHYTWIHHSSEITDIHVGLLGIYSRVATVSLDMTCKIYELESGILLASICMDVPLFSVAMDHAEYHLMLGTVNGSIYKIDTFSNSGPKIHHNELQNKFEFKGHCDKVTCLSVSKMGTQLLSGSHDKTCKLWNITTLSCLRTFHHDGAITNAFIAVKPYSFLSEEKFPPRLIVKSFQRDYESARNDDLLTPKLASQKFSLMHAEGPDDDFNHVLLQSTPENFVHGIPNSKASINELCAINLQLYSHALNIGINAYNEASSSEFSSS